MKDHLATGIEPPSKGIIGVEVAVPLPSPFGRWT